MARDNAWRNPIHGSTYSEVQLPKDGWFGSVRFGSNTTTVLIETKWTFNRLASRFVSRSPKFVLFRFESLLLVMPQRPYGQGFPMRGGH